MCVAGGEGGVISFKNYSLFIYNCLLLGNLKKENASDKRERFKFNIQLWSLLNSLL